MGVMISFGIRAGFWQSHHSLRESLSYMLAVKVPPCVCLLPVLCDASSFLYWRRQRTLIPVHLLFGIHDFKPATVSLAQVSLSQTGIFYHSLCGSQSVPMMVLFTFLCIISGLIYILKIWDQNYSPDSIIYIL